jgi:hypothetical protein
MKTKIFSILFILGLAFCNTQVFAQYGNEGGEDDFWTGTNSPMPDVTVTAQGNYWRNSVYQGTVVRDCFEYMQYCDVKYSGYDGRILEKGNCYETGGNYVCGSSPGSPEYGGGSGTQPPPPSSPPLSPDEDDDARKDCAGVKGGKAVNKEGCGCVGGTTGIDVNTTVNCPCAENASYNGSMASSNYSNYAKSLAAKFSPFDPKTTTQSEQVFAINNNSGVMEPSSILTVSTTGGSFASILTPNTEIIVHTHPYGGMPTPSPADFWDLANFKRNFKTSYIVAYDGSKYAMTIDDYDKLKVFEANNPYTVDDATAGFNTNSPIGIKWQKAGYDMLQSGFTGMEAEERALAMIMQQAGVTLMKAEPNSNVFKKIGAQQKTNADGTIASYIDDEGVEHPYYVKSDCK